MINLEKVSKDYFSESGRKKKRALDDVSLLIKKGEFVTLCGRSGAGKTTLLKLISSEEKPTEGSVLVGELDVGRIDPKEARKLRRKLGFIFQDYKLLAYKTVAENIAFALESTNLKDDYVTGEVERTLSVVGLEQKKNAFPNELSGGEKQRVAIARAIIRKPEIILADEPTGNLDPYHSRDIVKLLLKINDAGSTVILSTHNKEIVNNIQKRVITMEDGKIIRDEEEGRFTL